MIRRARIAWFLGLTFGASWLLGKASSRLAGV